MPKAICQLENLPQKISTIGVKKTMALAQIQILQIVAQTLNRLMNRSAYSKKVLTILKKNRE